LVVFSIFQEKIYNKRQYKRLHRKLIVEQQTPEVKSGAQET